MTRKIIVALFSAAIMLASGVIVKAGARDAPVPASESARAASADDLADEDAGDEAPKAPVIRINKIKLSGCKEISCRVIRSILYEEKTPWYKFKLKEGGYDPFWAEEDRRRIELFYQSRGYYSVQVSKPETEMDEKGKGAVISYEIVEGPVVHVSKIDVIFDDGVDEEADPRKMRQLMGCEEGDTFELEAYQSAASAMDTYYKDEGFYHSKVSRHAVVDPETNTAEITYRIWHGPRYRIRSIGVVGCVLTEPSVVMKAVNIEERDWYSRKVIIENQRRVQRLPIYRSVRVIEKLDEADHRIDLVFSVEEGEPREVKVGVGYASEELFRVQAQWRHVNFLGGARELTVSARWSELLEKEGVSFLQPNLRRPGDFFIVAAERLVETEDAYTHEGISLSPTYHFTLTRYLWSEVSYRIEQNRIADVSNALEIAEKDLAREGLLSAVSWRLEWADMDDLINPRQGARASLFMEVGGGVFGGDFPYIKVVGEARGYYPVYGPVIGALKWKLGWAEPYNDLQSLPLFKRFYSGGTGSVRGFERYQLGPMDPKNNPIGGAKLWESSLEFRFPVWKELGGVVFVDSGGVWLEDENYDPADVVYSVGFGVRYNTAIGPIALDLGFPLSGNSDYPDVRLHFNIGNSF